MSADKPCARQTFTVFPRFCLPTKLGPGRHFLHFLDFVCRQTLRLADIYCISSILSADKPCAWQTYSAFPLFCLPTSLAPGRHLLYFLDFVCRQTLRLADTFGFSSVLSADKPCARQTYSAFPMFCPPTNLVSGRHIRFYLCFVCQHHLVPDRHIYHFPSFVCRYTSPGRHIRLFLCFVCQHIVIS